MMDPNMFGPSGGFGGMQQNRMQGGMPQPTGMGVQGSMPRAPMPMGQPQNIGGGNMQPGMQTMPGAGGMQSSMPGNSLFGHSQGMGMGQGGSFQNTMQPRMGMPPQGQGIPPEVLQQLLQMFGSSQFGR